MKIDTKKYIKFFEYTIFAIIFMLALWLYTQMFFSSTLMCFIICVYSIISMMIIGVIGPILDDNAKIIIKLGYILFVGGAAVLYLVYLII